MEKVERELSGKFAKSFDEDGNVEVIRLRRYDGLDNKKVVGLVEVRNIGHVLLVFLEELSKVVDSIVVLDDFSTDDTRKLIFENGFKAELLLKKMGLWKRDELGDRKSLLKYGRKVGGTHFVLLDYDEFFSRNCVESGLLKREILKLRPGQSMYLKWIEVWKFPTLQRVLEDDADMNFLKRRQSVVFADDGKVQYDVKSSLARSIGGNNASIHVLRCPQTICPPPEKYRKGIRAHGNHESVVELDNCRILEFRFLNLGNTLLKAAWYEALGRVNGAEDGQTSGKMLTALFPATSKGHSISNHDKIVTSGVSPLLIPEKLQRLEDHPYNSAEMWRAEDILSWRKVYGARAFGNLTATSMIDFPNLNSASHSQSFGRRIQDVSRKSTGTVVLHVESYQTSGAVKKVVESCGAETLIVPGLEFLVVEEKAISKANWTQQDIHSYERLREIVQIEMSVQSALRQSHLKVVTLDATQWNHLQWLAWIHVSSRELSNVDIVYLGVGRTPVDLTSDTLNNFFQNPTSNMRILWVSPWSLSSLAGIVHLKNRLFGSQCKNDGSPERLVKIAEDQAKILKEAERLPVARLIFSNNVGRSGSAYLAHLFSTLGQGVISLHEPRCPDERCSGGGAFPMQHRSLASTYDERKSIKIPMIRKVLVDLVQDGPTVSMRTRSCSFNRNMSVGQREIIEFNGHRCTIFTFEDFMYVETNPNFKSWMYDIVLDTFPSLGYDVSIINLRKYIPAAVRSLYKTGYFTVRNGYSWIETANSINSRIPSHGDDASLSPVEKLVSYVLNAEVIAREMKKNYGSRSNVHFIDARSEIVVSKSGSLDLLKKLRLQANSLTEFVAGKRVDKYDGKGAKRWKVPGKSLNDIEKEVGMYMRKYEKISGDNGMRMIEHLKKVKDFNYRDEDLEE